MRKIGILVSGLIFAMGVGAQTEDPVLMTVNGKDITRSEFEYSYNKNNSEGVIDKKTLEEYVPLFVNFKLKVAAAEEAKIDTMSSIVKELRDYREQLVLPTIVDSDYVEQRARETYNSTAKRFEGYDMLTASHILVLMRQDATPEQQVIAKAKVDSIYSVLKGGADFAQVAKECSDDKGSAQRGGSLGQFGKGMMIPDFETAAYALKAGEMSEPVKTPVGWHIIKMEDRHPFESYEFHKDNIMKFLEQRGVQNAAANHYLDSISKLQGITREELIDQMCARIEAGDSDTKYLSQEYYDGTLMYEMCKTRIWDVVAKDEEGLAKYYSKNKKKYAWDSPRFKGIVIYAKDKSFVDEGKKLLKKEKDDTKWGQMLVSTFNTDSVKNVRTEHGIYKKGESRNVDVLVFGEKQEIKAKKDFPVTEVYGRKIKKPESYKDVRGLVLADYQTEKELEWVETLRQKYPVVINEDVLKTVNKH